MDPTKLTHIRRIALLAVAANLLGILLVAAALPMALLPLFALMAPLLTMAGIEAIAERAGRGSTATPELTATDDRPAHGRWSCRRLAA